MKAKEYLTKHYNSNNENNSEFGEPNSERFKSVIELMEAYAAQAADKRKLLIAFMDSVTTWQYECDTTENIVDGFLNKSK